MFLKRILKRKNMLNKQKVKIEYAIALAQLGCLPNEAYLTAGAALTMAGIREKTQDLDLTVTPEIFVKVIQSGKYEITSKIFPGDSFYGLSVKLNQTTDVHVGGYDYTPDIIEGVGCSKLQDILEQKCKMNREKDQADISALKRLLCD